MRKVIGPILTAVLAIGVIAAIVISMREQITDTVTVRGLIGSEKYEFFTDPRVVEALAKQGLRVEVQKAGSRQIATQFNAKEYDFVFPAGVPAAEKIRREQRITKSYTVFYTPMAIASWRQIVTVLEANGVSKKHSSGYHTVDMGALLKLVTQEKRWNQLAGNTEYSVSKSILLSSTDVRKSNSAAMYLSLASYLLNHENVVDSNEQINKLIGPLTGLFVRQGFVDSSSEAPFKDYVVMGPGKAPLVMIYESQFLFDAAQGGVNPNMVLLYPEPTIFTKHILVPVTANGERLGEALSNDPALQNLAIEHGFRNANTAGFAAFVKKRNLGTPEQLVNVIEPPSYEILERMIQLIEQRYKPEG